MFMHHPKKEQYAYMPEFVNDQVLQEKRNRLIITHLVSWV